MLLTNAAVQALRNHLARQIQEIGDGYQDRGLVFASQTGSTMSASNVVNRHFKPPPNRAGSPMVRLHDLRHTCATLLLVRGVHPRYVQALLGHANISVILDTYSHLTPAMKTRPWPRWKRSPARRHLHRGSCCPANGFVRRAARSNPEGYTVGTADVVRGCARTRAPRENGGRVLHQRSRTNLAPSV